MSLSNAEATLPQMEPDDRLLRSSVVRRTLLRPEMGAIVGAAALWIYFAIVAGDTGFLTMRGTASYLEVSAQLGILAIAVSLLMISGEFDLSIGSMIGAAGMIVAILPAQYGWSIWLAILAALVVSLLVGFVNGVIIRVTGLPSFIITLATLFIIRGLTIALTRIETNRTQVGGLTKVLHYDSAHKVFASKISVFGTDFPIVIVWWFALTAIATIVLMRTPFGNWIFGAGGNEQAARNVGVPVNRVKITLFMTTAVAAWLVAVIQVVGSTGADVLRGTQQEFYAIIAVVIGGTLLTGGYGSAIGAAIGALIFGMVRQGIVYAGVDADWFQVFLGGMLLLAVLINRFVRARAMEAR
ncbi:MAG TPA: ABC transporter permease [Thermomicrobiales bacterium]|nr:ABC transporter permease [Thermomicrobiales bacterium]